MVPQNQPPKTKTLFWLSLLGIAYFLYFLYPGEVSSAILLLIGINTYKRLYRVLEGV